MSYHDWREMKFGSSRLGELKGIGDLVAYHDRETASGTRLRDEWRVREVRDFAPEALVAAWGSDWHSYRPGASHVLEHRYIRDGVEEPWTPHQAANSEEQALQEVPDRVGDVALDPYLIELRELRKQAAAGHKRQVDLKKEQELEASERRSQRKRSEDAFERMRTSRTGKGAEWATKWNVFVQAHRDDAEYRDRAAKDAGYMERYRAVFDAESVPSKQKAIREFLAYAEKTGLGSFVRKR